MKTKFTNLHHSTNVVQTKHAVSVKKAVALGLNKSGDQNIVWLEIDGDSQISQLRQILFALDSSSLKLQVNEKPSLVNQSSLPRDRTFTNAVPDNNTHGVSCIKQCPVETQQRVSVAKRVTEMFQRSAKYRKESVKTKMLTSFTTLVEDGIKSTKIENCFHHFGEVLNIITLLDTGGQPEYIHLLPTVNVHPMVTFIVHDLSKSLEEQVLVEFSEHGRLVFEPYHLKYHNIDMIKFLMSSINDSLERTSSQVPQLVTIPGKNNQSYICCVGTHADKVSLNIMQNTDSQLTAMVEKLDCKTAVWLNENDGVLFSVDSTTAGDDAKEDRTAKVVRNRIDTLASLKDVYELPVTWMLFELEIQQLCSNNDRAYISVEECIFIAVNSGLITDGDEVRNALSYHHLLGVLLYYPEIAGLSDYVIVDHQWLFDRISSIVCFTFKHSNCNLYAKNKLKLQGILTKELLQELDWKEELKEEYFIALLVEMKIVAPIKREDGNGEDYFIPYILPNCSTQSQCDDILSQYGFLQGEPFLIQFKSNLLPRGFFCCLAVQMLQQLPQGWNHSLIKKDTYHTYSNLITFRLENAYSLSLIDKLSYLQVEIRHQESYYFHRFPIHFAVQDILANALETVCEQLSFNHGRLRYGFHCNCGEFVDQHIALLTRLAPPFDYALCRYGSATSTKLQKGHTVWLTDVRMLIKLLKLGIFFYLRYNPYNVYMCSCYYVYRILDNQVSLQIIHVLSSLQIAIIFLVWFDKPYRITNIECSYV